MDSQKLDLETAPEVDADELKLDGFVDERSLVCIATFVEGFASGWFFPLPQAFRDALDVKQTERTLKGKTETFWTQGKLYNFSAGDVVYDTPLAYTKDEEWRLTIKKIRLGIQVKEARPSTNFVTKEYQTVGPVPILEDKSEKPKKDRGGKERRYSVVYKRSRVDYGYVRFALLTPNLLKTALVQEAIYETDQELFVYFLQTGLLRCNDGKEYDFTNRVGRALERL